MIIERQDKPAETMSSSLKGLLHVTSKMTNSFRIAVDWDLCDRTHAHRVEETGCYRFLPFPDFPRLLIKSRLLTPVITTGERREQATLSQTGHQSPAKVESYCRPERLPKWCRNQQRQDAVWGRVVGAAWKRRTQ